MNRVLILSGSTGQGHNSCANAIAEYMELHQMSYEVKDCFTFISDGFSKFMSWGHSFMYRHIPRLFEWGYSFSGKHKNIFQQGSLIYETLVYGTDGMYRYIISGGFNTVICTHPLAAIMLTHTVEKYQMDIATSFVTTDYTCYPCMEAIHVQTYFAPSEKIADAFEKSGIDREKIVVSGIPIAQNFLQRLDKKDAKRLLNIDVEHKHFLIMCGSMGCGNMEELVRAAVKRMTTDVEISVICGTNRRLEKRLRVIFRHIERIHIVGYTKQMSIYMDSADLCLTKPGGMSVTEGAAKHLPMAFINAVAGCEKYNTIYFVSAGAAIVSDGYKRLIDACVSLLTDQDRKANMQKSLESISLGNGAEIIVEGLKRYAA